MLLTCRSYGAKSHVFGLCRCSLFTYLCYNSITMKTLFAALATLILLASFMGPQGNTEVKYETDGHYWTVYLVSVLLKNPDARSLAFYSELPDWECDTLGCHMRATSTYLKPAWQGRVHALTGGDPIKERNCSADWVRQATTLEMKGHALHRLGDSFAHTRRNGKKMFPKGVGHAFAGHWPDKIKNDTSKYILYVNTMAKALGGEDAVIDMTAFHYVCKAQLGSNANIEILKSEVQIQNKQKMYAVSYNETKAAEDYLNYRKDSKNFTFTIKPGNKKKKEDAVVTIAYK